MKQPTLKIEEIQAISNGTYGDIFSVLGMHSIKINGKEKLVFRAFRPDAESIYLKIPSRNTPTKVERIEGTDLFEHVFSRRKNRCDYTLLIEPREGDSFEIHDPYNFESLISDFDLQLWGEGNHHHAYKWMGAHKKTVDGVEGTHFVVVAPNADRVSVIGPFNNWDGRTHCMRKHPAQGIWEIFIPLITDGDLYKYELKTPFNDAPLKNLIHMRFILSSVQKPHQKCMRVHLNGKIPHG